MEKINVAINGFGRIGRITLRELLKREHVNVVAINDLTDTTTLAHLFKYDSVHRAYPGTVAHTADSITVDGRAIKVFALRDPEALPWAELNVDIVVEATGIFRSKEAAGKHITAGASKVIISAPAKGDGVKAVVLGVNEGVLDGSEQVISNASCTTNCAAPMVKVLDEKWGIDRAFLTTIHAYTADQALQDSPHPDLRRARAAAESIVPTSTGAANAVQKIFPHLKGKLEGGAVRVPVPDGSLTELTCILNKDVTADELNAAFSAAAGNELKGIMEYQTDPIVSVDILSNPHSCILDAGLTVANGNFVKVVGWYDNEYGYSSRVADLVEKLAVESVPAG